MKKVEAFWICRLFSMQDHQCVQERQWFRWLSKSSYNQEVGSSHPGSHRYRLSLCPRARHFTLNEVDGSGWRGYGTDWHMSQGSCGYYYYYYFWLIRENVNDYSDKDPKSQNALLILLKKREHLFFWFGFPSNCPWLCFYVLDPASTLCISYFSNIY